MDCKKILTDDQIHLEALNHKDPLSYFEGAKWAREQMEQYINAVCQR